MTATTRAWLMLLAVVSLGLSGCGGPALPALAPVKGKVMVGQEAVTAGQVSLIPLVVDENKQVPPSSGQIDSSGNYEIFTGGKSGAPEGKYKVTVTPAMGAPVEGAKGPPKAPYHDRFRHALGTTLQIEVVANPQPNAYDLKLTK